MKIHHLNCGDAYIFKGEMSSQQPNSTRVLSLFQRLMETDHTGRMNNQNRLRALKKNHGDSIQMFCSHDHGEQLLCAQGGGHAR